MPFINLTGLNRQVRSAYGTGALKIGSLDEYSVIVTSLIGVAVKEKYESNKMKAIITEQVGFLPVYDETSGGKGFIAAQKETKNRDLEKQETEIIETLLFPERPLVGYTITPVIIKERSMNIRIIQNPSTLKCLGVRQELLDLITRKDIDYDVEGDPTGPAVNEKTGFVYFTNDTTILALPIYPINKDKNKQIIDVLNLVDMKEEVDA